MSYHLYDILISIMNETVALSIFIIVSIILGYLSGSILWSVFIGKHFYDKDLREFGSKNAGATNSLRIYGKKVAVLVLLLDVFKCILPTIIMWLVGRYALAPYFTVTESFNPFSLVFLTPLFALIGHCYPIFYKFKGGKGASSLGAFMLCVNPFAGITCFLIFVGIIKITKYVSLSSIITSILTIIFLFIPGVNWMFMLNLPITTILMINGYGVYWVLFVAALVAIGVAILIWKHHTNITRLLKGEETKFGRKKD